MVGDVRQTISRQRKDDSECTTGLRVSPGRLLTVRSHSVYSNNLSIELV